MHALSGIRKIAILGDYLPRKCGIATLASDVLTAVAAEHPQSQCFAVPVNDIAGGRAIHHGLGGASARWNVTWCSQTFRKW